MASLILLVGCGGSGSGSSESGQRLQLQSLTVEGVTLDQVFQSTQYQYSGDASFLINSITVTAQVSDSTHELIINGKSILSGQPTELDIAIGGNEISVDVISPDTTTRYLVDITRMSIGDLVQQRIEPSNGEFDDRFGISSVIDGDYLLVGSYGEDSDGSSESDDSLRASGAIYVFKKTGDQWMQTQYLKINTPQSFDNLGKVIAADNGVLVASLVGRNDSAGGAVVFRRQNDLWVQEQILTPTNSEQGDGFGSALGISGSTIVISAPEEDGDGSSQSNNDSNSAGAVYVFEYGSGIWSQAQYLKASNVGIGAPGFGNALSIDGDILAIGAEYEGSGPLGGSNLDVPLSGAVYMFHKQGSSWVEASQLKAPNLDENDRFGNNVVVSGNRVAAVSLNEGSDGSSQNDNSLSGVGAVYTFVRNNDGWQFESYIKASDARDGDLFGISIDMDDDWLLIGSWNDGSNISESDPVSAGSAYLFEYSSGEWVERKRISPEEPEIRGLYGSSVSIDSENQRMLIGEQRHGNDIGAAYVID